MSFPQALAVPKRLLGASMGALFFSITLGTAIAPAILGSAMNTTYAKKLLESAFAKEGFHGSDLFKPTVLAIRNSMQAGLRVVFLLGRRINADFIPANPHCP